VSSGAPPDPLAVIRGGEGRNGKKRVGNIGGETGGRGHVPLYYDRGAE